MTQDRYDRINQKLLSITKDDPEAKECKKILDMLEIPVFWVSGKATYQLDPCVIIENNEAEGESE